MNLLSSICKQAKKLFCRHIYIKNDIWMFCIKCHAQYEWCEEAQGYKHADGAFSKQQVIGLIEDGKNKKSSLCNCQQDIE
jgi:hypothetical protein